jgi:hypothetical protein
LFFVIAGGRASIPYLAYTTTEDAKDEGKPTKAATIATAKASTGDE